MSRWIPLTLMLVPLSFFYALALGPGDVPMVVRLFCFGVAAFWTWASFEMARDEWRRK